MSVMSRVSANPSKVTQTKPWEYGVRFLFGGIITAAVGIIGQTWGPVVAGLFLAFPAILPASLTLVSKHQDQRAAGFDAMGAAIGSVGLVAFAIVVWRAAPAWPAWAMLVVAMTAWLVVSVVLWWGFCRVRER